jgi:hypothetical protein
MNEIIDAYCTPGTQRDTKLAPAELLQWMDEAGIHRAVVAPEDREIAVDNTAGNRRVLHIAERSLPGPGCSCCPPRCKGSV